MNKAHLELLASADWKRVLSDLAFPFAFGQRRPSDLGDDVLEIGPGPGMTTDLLRTEVARLTSVEIDPDLAAQLTSRLAGSNVTVVNQDASALDLEDDAFSGAVTFTVLHHVPTAAAQDALFTEVSRVLRPGGLLIANDSVASDELRALHDDDIYNPIDPTTLADRLAAAGFVDIEVRTNPYAWAAHCRAGGSTGG